MSKNETLLRPKKKAIREEERWMIPARTWRDFRETGSLCRLERCLRSLETTEFDRDEAPDMTDRRVERWKMAWLADNKLFDCCETPRAKETRRDHRAGPIVARFEKWRRYLSIVESLAQTYGDWRAIIRGSSIILKIPLMDEKKN